jgi:hypothetical protein
VFRTRRNKIIKIVRTTLDHAFYGIISAIPEIGVTQELTEARMNYRIGQINQAKIC